MGFFSWLTADTQESIPCIYADHPNSGRPVYLIQPAGKPPIREDSYEGHGVFGGINAYLWLARQNLDEQLTAGRTDDELIMFGTSIHHAMYFRDTETKAELCIFDDLRRLVPHLTYYPQRYNEMIPQLGGTGNDLIKSGRLERLSYAHSYPLKFSFDPNAVYEDLPGSDRCTAQGIYYDN